MQENTEKRYTKSQEVELPQSIINEFARFLVPEIRKYYESKQGKREFTEWEAKRKEAANQAGK